MTLNTILLIGTALSGFVTFVVHRHRVGKWHGSVDLKVTGPIAYHPPEARNQDLFLQGVEWVLILITLAFGVFAVGTIPNY